MLAGWVIGMIAKSEEFNGLSCTPSNCAGVGDKNLDMSAVTSSVGLSHRIQLHRNGSRAVMMGAMMKMMEIEEAWNRIGKVKEVRSAV